MKKIDYTEEDFEKDLKEAKTLEDSSLSMAYKILQRLAIMHLDLKFHAIKTNNLLIDIFNETKKQCIAMEKLQRKR